MKICITGINGFVGTCLANHLLKQGHEVSGIGRQEKLSTQVDKKCSYIQNDLTKVVQPIDADLVIHSAALANDKAKYKNLYENNVRATENVLEAAGSARCFIQISSSSVYFFGNSAMIENEAGKNFNKLSAYGQTKFLAEQKVISGNSIPSRIILRPRAIYGIQDRLILPRLLRLVKGNRLILPKHVTKSISLTHIDNLIASVELCMNTTSNPLQIYNVCDDKVYDLGEVIANLVSAVTEKEKKLVKIPAAIWESLVQLNRFIKFNPFLSPFASKQLTQSALMDLSAIRSELNYQPKKTIDTSYAEIAEWVISQGGWKQYLMEQQKQIEQSNR